MIRRLLLLFFAIVVANGVFAQSGTIKGKVLDEDTGEPIPFANVSVEQEGKVVTGGMTDFDGVYTIKPVPVGRFTVKASYMGYKTIALSDLQVNNAKITFQDFKLPASVSKLEEVVVKEYKVPLISKDQVESGGTVTQEDIDKMPGRSATAIASTVGGVNDDGNGNLSIRGARSEGTVYYVDGVKVMASTLPKSAIEQVNVITGGLSSKYGDATGGIVNITTKGASKEFHGGVELVTSEFLDGYGYNLAQLTLTGPIYSKKTVDPYDSLKINKKPIVGFLVTGDVNYQRDVDPDINGTWVAKDGVRENNLAHPIISSPQQEGLDIVTYASEYYGEDQFENIKAKPNNSLLSVNSTAKININVTDNLILSVGGRYRYYSRDLYSFRNSVMNSENNGHRNYNNWQVNGRVVHKLANKTEEEEKKSASVLKNIYYELVGSYEKEYYKSFNKDFDTDFFKYGHVGTFKTYKMPTYEYTTQLEGYPHGIYVMNGYADTLIDYTPSQYNEELATYTENYYSLFDKGSIYYRNRDLLLNVGGLLNGYNPNRIYGIFNSPGTPYDAYAITDNSQMIFSGNGSADIGNHEFQIGFEFEQRDERAYRLSPVELWLHANNLMNKHITELDLDNPIRHYITDADGNIINQDTISYNRLYSEGNQSMFDIKFREYLESKGAIIDGQAVKYNSTNWIDVDSYDPSDLAVEYFSADELINEGNKIGIDNVSSFVGYYGYDVYGNKITTNPTLEDFLNETNEYGFKTRPIAAFKPNYLAFYLQDKFSFDDLIFRVGVRVDRYDANQQVLKDAYSLNETYTVADVKNSTHADLLNGMPSNIGDDYIVYANSININEASSINGYRIGNDPANIKWYNASGTQIDDPNEIASSTGVAPLLLYPTSTINGASSNNPELKSSAFTDYVPQWNIMPRIAFSFPISDVALFSAHYDVMTKRPFGVNRLNPIQYLHIQTYAQDVINNPNLLPEKTIEYELGFQQKISNTSSLKIAAFYREMRGQAQVQNIYGAYPTNYITYQNIDFGTVKGATFTYDLRRTGNVRMMISYTLQFANGTGSDAQTALNLIKQDEPNLRQTLPLDFDQRHTIKGSVDYSYADGKAYNGPVLFGKDILQNTGVTFIPLFSTGSPYSKKDPTTDKLLGSVNGSRMPSIFKVDMKIYRDFMLNQGKDKKTPLALQVYVDVFNLFNTFNPLQVFSTTGNANDDAYLTTAKNQAEINAQLNPYSYSNYYSMSIDMYGYYMSPRTIRLGLLLNF
ncbi:MAG: carboxypeptidase-like regulatory domain-containing protein [Bacteroidales bacterium]|nr:carboxypeptidase-like regulatory domain-containing protein [Bacteroidales bacterium]